MATVVAATPAIFRRRGDSALELDEETERYQKGLVSLRTKRRGRRRPIGVVSQVLRSSRMLFGDMGAGSYLGKGGRAISRLAESARGAQTGPRQHVGQSDI